jgi:hypothetical protein
MGAPFGHTMASPVGVEEQLADVPGVHEHPSLTLPSQLSSMGVEQFSGAVGNADALRSSQSSCGIPDAIFHPPGGQHSSCVVPSAQGRGWLVQASGAVVGMSKLHTCTFA